MTLLQHLNDVSIERGFRDFRHLTDDGLVYVVHNIIKEAGERYAKECVVKSLEKASENAKTSYSCSVWNCEGQSVNKESITNENNIILF